MSLLTRRFLLAVTLSAAFVGLVTEGAHYFLKEDDRRPEQFAIVIPEGTDELIKAGEDIASIPQDMVFVTGDTLKIINNDVVSHQLGPIWVPPGSQGELVMEDAARYSYACSFKPSKYLDLNIKRRTTNLSRLRAFGLAVPPTTAFIFIYSLILFPIDKTKHSPNENAS